MFCKKCGKELPDDSKFCPECGTDLTAKENSIPSTVIRQATTPPNNQMILGILTTIFCCVPFGIVSIVYASRVDSYWNADKHEEALAFAHKAKSWAVWGIVLTAVFYILIVLLVLAGVIGAEYFDAYDF